jgi:hypothetical protein
MNTGYRLACANGKETLFKFRAFTTEEDQRRVADILVNHRVYFSRVSELNDPYDMRPEFVLAGDPSDPNLRPRIIQEAEGKFRAYQPPHTEEWIQGQLAQLRVIPLEQLVERAGRNVAERMERDHPVFCLAGNRDSVPMWMAYADNYTGLCIHFKATPGLTRDFAFGTARQVLYRDQRPQIALSLAIDDDEMVDRLSLIKHTSWQHEDEYRLLTYPDDDFGLGRDGSYARFDAGALQGISVGSQMSDENIQLVRDLAHRHVPALPIWRATVRPMGFGFAFELICDSR